MIKNTNIARILNLVLCLALILQFVPMLATTPAVAADDGYELNSQIIVSMGDSFSSGESIEPYYGQQKDGKDLPRTEKVKSQDWLAHRSTQSWPGMLELHGVDGPMSKHHGKHTHWYFVASSGAVTDDVVGRKNTPYHGQKKEYQLIPDFGVVNNRFSTHTEYLRPQIEVFNQLDREGKKADYVTITIGGNDMGFTDVVAEASIKGILTPTTFKEFMEQKWEYFYSEGRKKIKDTYIEIWERSGGAKIIVAGYPHLLDDTGNGVIFFERTSHPMNEHISRFNAELQKIVNECVAEKGMKICFVPVEDKFDGHEAYTDEPFLTKVHLVPKGEDLMYEGISASSVHPNPDGARKYADAVNAKIEDIEKDGGRSEWPELFGSDEREIVLVLDNSGSMDGSRLNETKEAAKKFFDAILKEDASIGIVTYNTSASKLAYFNRSESYLDYVVDNLGTAGRTNTDAGLQAAEEMLSESKAKKKIIVLMSDGLANEGRVGSSLIAYADELKAKGIYIYTLGFLLDSGDAQSLMQGVASPGCHYEVDDASSLAFFFGDIADLIRGEKYIYVRIACPVDVVVKHDGEVLSSKDDAKHQRTDFGTLTYEQSAYSSGGDDRIKILRLKPGAKYDIEIEGNGYGEMNYTIGYMDEDGNYSDMREFNNIRITERTKIDTIAVEDTNYTVLNVDEDGDGSYDLVYKAGVNGTAEIIDMSTLVWVLVLPIIALFGIIVVLIVKKHKKKKEA